MVYGIILDSARDSIVYGYGENRWKRIVHELSLPSETFDPYASYDDKLIMDICECLVDMLREGTVNTYLQFLGQDFFRYFLNFGYGKLFRVAGRTLREFYLAIDQLHDSNRYTFVGMQQPLFHITSEDESGATLNYKSPRLGFTYYAIGSLIGAAQTLFNMHDIKVHITDDLSTKEYTYVVLRADFDNSKFMRKPVFKFPVMPSLSGPTFFKVFPFSILMDSSLRIRQLGHHLIKLFPSDTPLVGRSLDQVFRLIRPDIHVEWNKILSYGRHIVFLMENRLPLLNGPNGRIRLKGQMKYIENQNMVWFLCHPVLGCTDDMIAAGLHITDLNLFDGTGEYLIANVHQMREAEEAVRKQKLCISQLQQVDTELVRCGKRSQNILSMMVPKHIATMIRSGITAYGLCESYPLLTILFATIVDFKISTALLVPSQVVGLLNGILNLFDDIADKFDVFKVKTKMDASYMIVAGLHDRSNILSEKTSPSTVYTVVNAGNNEDKNVVLRLNPTETIAYLSLELIEASELLINPLTRKPFGIRIGFHAGAAVGGIIGDQNLQYCLFGEAVETARHMMMTGESGQVHVSHAVYVQLLENNRFILNYREKSDSETENPVPTYWLTGINWKSFELEIKKTTKPFDCPWQDRIGDHF